jgi:hypothetical protein
MAKSTNRFGKKLEKARTKRGLSIYQACMKSGSLKRESLHRLETGRTDPEKVLVRTMLEIVHLYWPDIQSSDFVTNKDLRRYRFTHPIAEVPHG